MHGAEGMAWERTQLAVNIATLDDLLERGLLPTLRANSIDLETGHLCVELLVILRRFLRRVARQYQPEIDALLQLETVRHSEQDLISWVAKEMKTLQSMTFSMFYLQICQDEGLNPGQHRVNCATAHSHSYLLAQVFQQAVAQWRADHTLIPLSPKYVRKHKKRDWAPWLVDLIFGRDDEDDDDDHRQQGNGGTTRRRA